MKKHNSDKIEKKILLVRKRKKSLDIKAEEQPLRLGQKVAGDKIVLVRQTAAPIFKDIPDKRKPSESTSGSHSLSALRSFRSK